MKKIYYFECNYSNMDDLITKEIDNEILQEDKKTYKAVDRFGDLRFVNKSNYIFPSAKSICENLDLRPYHYRYYGEDDLIQDFYHLGFVYDEKEDEKDCVKAKQIIKELCLKNYIDSIKSKIEHLNCCLEEAKIKLGEIKHEVYNL